MAEGHRKKKEGGGRGTGFPTFLVSALPEGKEKRGEKRRVIKKTSFLNRARVETEGNEREKKEEEGRKPWLDPPVP